MSDPWSWKAVLVVFSATDAGSLVWVLGLAVVFWRGKKEKYESRLTEGVARMALINCPLLTFSLFLGLKPLSIACFVHASNLNCIESISVRNVIMFNHRGNSEIHDRMTL